MIRPLALLASLCPLLAHCGVQDAPEVVSGLVLARHCQVASGWFLPRYRYSATVRTATGRVVRVSVPEEWFGAVEVYGTVSGPVEVD